MEPKSGSSSNNKMIKDEGGIGPAVQTVLTVTRDPAKGVKSLFAECPIVTLARGDVVVESFTRLTLS